MSWPVRLYVYDLTGGMARALSPQFLGRQLEGIWHTGIVVYGMEFFFGGGIQRMLPGQSPYGTPVQILELGTTSIPQEVFEEFLQSISSKYTMQTYDILDNNCNNFTNEASNFLLGHGIPEHITGLPSEILNTPMGRMFAPMVRQMTEGMRTQMAGMQSPAFPSPLPSPSFNPYASRQTPVAIAVGHPHESVQLRLLRFSEPTLYATGQVEKLFPKLDSCLGEAGFVLGDDERKLVNDLRSSLERKQILSTSMIVDMAPIFKRMFETLPDDKVFPAIDLFRLLISDSGACKYYASEGLAIVEGLQQRFLFADDARSRSFACRLLTFMLTCNMFSAAEGAESQLSNISRTVEVINTGLEDEKMHIKQAAAYLCYNCSRLVASRDSDTVMAFLTAAVHGLNTISSPSDECAIALVMAVGKLIYKNNEAVELVRSLELNLSAFLVAPSQKLRDAAKELSELIKVTPNAQ